MADKSYWLAVFTGTTWQEFLKSGATVHGVNERYRTTVSKTNPGDYLLCYIAGISRFIACLEITSPPFRANDDIWAYDLYPLRLKVKPVVVLTPETAVPVTEIKDQLSVVQNLKASANWAMLFRNSIRGWNKSDAEIVIKALNKAKKNPIERPVSKHKFEREPH